jgi:hypothetical protein
LLASLFFLFFSITSPSAAATVFSFSSSPRVPRISFLTPRPHAGFDKEKETLKQADSTQSFFPAAAFVSSPRRVLL